MKGKLLGPPQTVRGITALGTQRLHFLSKGWAEASPPAGSYREGGESQQAESEPEQQPAIGSTTCLLRVSLGRHWHIHTALMAYRTGTLRGTPLLWGAP